MQDTEQQKIMQDEKNNLIGKKLLRRYLIIVFVFLLILSSFWAGFSHGKYSNQNFDAKLFKKSTDSKFEDKKGEEADFALFWQVLDLLKEKYVDSEKLEAQKLFYGAIKGMLAATGDPYTNFFDPEENEAFGEDISGSFEGIGAELSTKDNVLTVVAPLEGTPAEKAGLRAGDKIIKINGKISADMNINQAVDLIRGPKKTDVVLTIFREGEQDTREITIQREIITVHSVKYEIKDNSIGYIKVNRFGDDTTKEFSQALAKIVAAKSEGLIIDLRNNPGGYLESAVDMASMMVEKGSVVVIEEDGNSKRKEVRTRGGDIASNIKTVILINEGSASASEILAGAMREVRQNVTLVGEKSYGKGSVQEFIKLPQKTAVKITVARWLTPNGEQINEQGIKPDIEVELTNEDYQNKRDPQLDKAMEIVKSK